MTQTTVAQLIQAIKKDPDLKAKLKAAVDLESYYKITADYGYHFTAEELQTELSQQTQKELAESIDPGIAPRHHLGAQ